MHIFGEHWVDHWQKIKIDWQTKVTDQDTVLLLGDTSWFLKLEDALEDLNEIASLPGKKVLIRGNHDYWWASARKMKLALADKFIFLQGHSCLLPTDSTIAIGGTRGYLCPGDTAFKAVADTPIYERELLRTEVALQEMQALQATTNILLLHYPPFSDQSTDNGFAELLQTYHVHHCLFGHLHDTLSFQRVPEKIGSTQLHLVSADYLHFTLKEIL